MVPFAGALGFGRVQCDRGDGEYADETERDAAGAVQIRRFLRQVSPPFPRPVVAGPFASRHLVPESLASIGRQLSRGRRVYPSTLSDPARENGRDHGTTGQNRVSKLPRS
jgi:hypothetical protein